MGKVYEVIVIGSGFGGVCAAVNLHKIGVSDLLMLERDEELGGTWWRNSYPGAAVDVQSHLYSFSFEPYNWTRLFAQQPELLEYTRHVLNKYKIHDIARTNANVEEVKFLDELQLWEVTYRDRASGEMVSERGRNVVNASGGLSQPRIPDFPGKDRFKGASMHTGRWDHSFDYTGKRVAVIGSGASAVQVIPAIADKVSKLYVFQRTPHWVMPRPDRKLTAPERWVHGKTKVFSRAYRSFLYWQLEMRLLAFRYFPGFFKTFPAWMGKFNIRRHIKDKDMRQRVMPDYTMGCKRILISNDYYPTLVRDNVELVDRTEGLRAITETGVLTGNLRELDVDMIVYATGFYASENNVAYPVFGREGASIQEVWGKAAHAYLGSAIPGFPNFYTITGPNTGIGHTSAIYMIESQMKYIIQAIQASLGTERKTVEVKQAVEQEYNTWLQDEMKHTIWQKGGCDSWYQNSEGVNTTMYPGFTFLFRRDCANFKPEHHTIKPVEVRSTEAATNEEAATSAENSAKPSEKNPPKSSVKHEKDEPVKVKV